MNPLTPHGGIPAELRCRFMFRYYDSNNDKVLSLEDFKRLLRDLRASRGLPVDEKAVESECQDAVSIFDLQGDGCDIPLDSFLNAVGHLRFRGTSSLLRFQSPLRGRKTELDLESLGKRKALSGRPPIHAAISGKSVFSFTVLRCSHGLIFDRSCY